MPQANLASNGPVVSKYLAIPQPEDKVLATYVWIDGTGENLRSKTRTISFVPTKAEQLPIWNFCGSATGHATGNFAELYLRPVALYNDPFYLNNNKLVLCETITNEHKPVALNTRAPCLEAMSKVMASHEPWFGIGQEYSLVSASNRVANHPYGWPADGFPGPQGPYFCGVGANKVFGRDVVMAHYRACLYAGIAIYGDNAEVMPSHWEYQVGPCKGISIGDDLWMSRYILTRVAEDFHVSVSFNPKPVTGKWTGAGAHCNFSTIQTRAAGGLTAIQEAINRLSENHARHMKAYNSRGGKDNEQSLIGGPSTSTIENFSTGVDDRGASVRIPRQVADAKCGHLEDRRPASNCDPYVVTEALVRTVCLGE